MRPYLLTAVATAALLLALFGLAHLLDVPLLADESPDVGDAGPAAAATSFALLAGDCVLPVPSSAVMLLNGSLFGPVGGTALSLAGSEAGALLGWWLGRRAGPALARVAAPPARERARRLVAQHGALAVVVTRPIPIVAETVAILAGAAGMPLSRLAVAAAAGSLAPALGYAIAGAYAERYDAGLAVFAGVLVLAVGFWGFDRSRRQRVTAG